MSATSNAKVKKVHYVPHISNIDAFQEHFKAPPKVMKGFYVVKNQASERFKNDTDKTVIISPEQSIVNQAKSQLEDEKRRGGDAPKQLTDSFSVIPTVTHATPATSRKRKTPPVKNAGRPSKSSKGKQSSTKSSTKNVSKRK